MSFHKLIIEKPDYVGKQMSLYNVQSHSLEAEDTTLYSTGSTSYVLVKTYSVTTRRCRRVCVSTYTSDTSSFVFVKVTFWDGVNETIIFEKYHNYTTPTSYDTSLFICDVGEIRIYIKAELDGYIAYLSYSAIFYYPMTRVDAIGVEVNLALIYPLITVRSFDDDPAYKIITTNVVHSANALSVRTFYKSLVFASSTSGKIFVIHVPGIIY